jgi:hypothetical protein
MAVSDVLSAVMGLIPYLNMGIVTLITSLVLDRAGFKITKREFRKQPVRNLFLGLGLVVVSSIIALIIQTELSGFQPIFAFIVLFLSYVVLTQV